MRFLAQGSGHVQRTFGRSLQGVNLPHLSDISKCWAIRAAAETLSVEMRVHEAVALCEGGEPCGQSVVTLPPVACIMAQVEIA